MSAPDAEALARFWSKVNRGAADACWPWIACRDRKGYGRVSFGGRMFFAHRLIWILVRGAIPTGVCVLHYCDNPPCCNPDHLFLGTNADNIADRTAKGRSAAGERNGLSVHPECVPRIRGERNGSAKLTEAIVRIIRAKRIEGHTQTELAATYGVAQSAISRIDHGVCWKHLWSATNVEGQRD